jgi:HK97 family phage major capsid protein
MDIRERRTKAYGIELRGETAERYTQARIAGRQGHGAALQAAVGAADGADELLEELATLAETLREERREPTRRERGRLRYIIGKTRALAEGIGGDDEALEVRGRLGFDPRAAAASSGADDRTLGDWLATETRALLESTGVGQYIVPDDYRPQVWDRLAASSVAFRAGFRVIETDSDTLRIPAVTADVTANWTAEGATITASDPTLAEVVATPRKLAAITEVTNELIERLQPRRIPDNHSSREPGMRSVRPLRWRRESPLA